MSPNHLLDFPSILGGLAICNPANDGGETGTIGCIATSDGFDRWILSCYHVLCRSQSPKPFGSLEPIVLNFVADVPQIAEVSDLRINRELDCAAALILTRSSQPRILGIGRLAPPSAPSVGVRVIKSGAATGVTEGTIRSVAGSKVTIDSGAYPPGYQLSERGDSGAIWVDAETMSPLVLHQGELTPGVVFGTALIEVLRVLQLTIVQEPGTASPAMPQLTWRRPPL